MAKFFLISLIILAGKFSFGQATENNWYFGFGAGITFNPGSPTPLLDNAFTTDEGAAAISDSSGNLLFYTNGVDVYNSQHQRMPNGANLAGGESASQSALIVPDPANDEGYYLFTVAAQLAPLGGYTGLSYSYIDMNAAGQLGDVIQKNIPLLDSTTEKLSASWHYDGKSIWVICHKWNSNAFYAYLVTCNGIEEPVISNAGSIHGLDVTGGTLSAIGCMKINVQGNKLATAWTYVHTLSSGNVFSYANIELFDFDHTTGIISNPYLIQYGTLADNYVLSYGVAFSPSGKYLYNTYYYAFPSSAGIDQYDLNSGDIINSKTTIGTSGATEAFGTMQLGVDGKIYIAKTNGQTTLSVLSSPDLAGVACGFNHSGASLGGKASTWGLPNNWATLTQIPEFEIFDINDTTACNDQDLVLDATYPNTFARVSYLWNTGETTPVIQAENSGLYIVKLFLPCDTIIDSINVIINSTPFFEFGDELFHCEDEVLLLSGPVCTGCEYLWSTGDTVHSIAVKETGELWLKIGDSNCVYIDTINVEMVKCECNFYIPNAFSPNNDGRNDFFTPVFYCDVSEFEIKIFNRWGEKVFNTDIPGSGWSGKVNNEKVPQGVYAYVIDYTPKLKNIPQSKVTKAGTIAVIY